MQNVNKNIMDIDERKMGRSGIEEMLARMSEIKVSSDTKPEQEKRETA